MHNKRLKLEQDLVKLNEETRNFLYASVKKNKLTVNKPI